jgi:hypothetical protein
MPAVSLGAKLSRSAPVVESRKPILPSPFPVMSNLPSVEWVSTVSPRALTRFLSLAVATSKMAKSLWGPHVARVFSSGETLMARTAALNSGDSAASLPPRRSHSFSSPGVAQSPLPEANFVSSRKKANARTCKLCPVNCRFDKDVGTSKSLTAFAIPTANVWPSADRPSAEMDPPTLTTWPSVAASRFHTLSKPSVPMAATALPFGATASESTLA